MPKTVAIILAAGMGSRMGNVSKASLEINSVPALALTSIAFERAKNVDGIILAVREDEFEYANRLMDKYSISKHIKTVIGSTTRQKSAKNAFLQVGEDVDFIAIHDGARCLIDAEQIDEVIDRAYIKKAATACVKVTDTVKYAEDGEIKSTVDREKLYAVQTPQVFDRSLYKKAIAIAESEGKDFTDDCALMENIGVSVSIVETSKTNVKLTTREDLFLAEAILDKRGTKMRVGSGYDAHRLVNDRALILGGVNIPFEKGLLGHSDADVAVHALMDALLGACALGDIGKHFPPSDEQYRGISSIELLSRVYKIIRSEGYTVGNVDVTIVCQAPKLAPYLEEMRKNIANTLSVCIQNVSVKATTEEKMGFTGNGEGIAAHCVCTINKIV